MGDASDRLRDRILTEEPAEILDSSFTESEVESLSSIRHELGICIRWGRLGERVISTLVEAMDALIFLEHPNQKPSVVKRIPYEALWPEDQGRINGASNKSRMSREYLLLKLAQKLLGVMKTNIKKKLDSFDLLDDDTEGRLRDQIAFEEGFPEEEMNSVTTLTAEVDTSDDCSHRRFSVFKVNSDRSTSGFDELNTICKDCRALLKSKKLAGLTTTPSSSQRRFRQKRKCRHQAVWVEGKEGEEAYCSNCGEIIEDAKDWQWKKAGLEEWGDDPDSDTLTHFTVTPDQIFKVEEDSIGEEIACES